MHANGDQDWHDLATHIKQWGQELGFQQIGIADLALGDHPARLRAWLAAGYHGDMAYMAKHEEIRANPALMKPGAVRVISARMDCIPEKPNFEALQDGSRAYIARYALGRDYHRIVRRRLAQLAERIDQVARRLQPRAFTDSAPLLERAMASRAGLGWIGKNTMLINPKAGSWFVLGEILTDIPLPVDPPFERNHCGSCQACLDICPTDAFVGPYQLDGRKCISYLTIESKGPIPPALRPKLGNRVFGCDDCQLICPWNKFSRPATDDGFTPRHGLDQAGLVELFLWDEATYLQKTEGSALRRIGYEGWLRNLAVGLGNGPFKPIVVAALQSRLDFPSALVQEHVRWALTQLGQRATTIASDRLAADNTRSSSA